MPFPDQESIKVLANLVLSGGARRYEWGLHPPPHMPTGIITDIPQAILQAFPVATKWMYVIGCCDAEGLKGERVQLLQQVLLIHVKGLSSVQA